MDLFHKNKRFNDAIKDAVNTKRKNNSAYLNAQEYEKKTEDVKTSEEALKTSEVKKTIRDYRLVHKCSILVINGTENLIKPIRNASENILYYVKNEDSTFSTLRILQLGMEGGTGC